MAYKLTYFPIPGRGEVIRLMLTLGDFQFEDEHVQFKEWPQKKSGTPWGTIPMLKLPDGFVAGQSRAMLRYLGKLVKVDGVPLYPTDPHQALLVDEIGDSLEDIWGNLVAKILQVPGEQKASNAEKMLAKDGEVSILLDRLEDHVVGPYATGKGPTIADVYIFAAFGQWSSGFFKGVSIPALIGGRPKLEAILKHVSSMTKIKQYYAKILANKGTELWGAYGQFAKL